MFYENTCAGNTHGNEFRAYRIRDPLGTVLLKGKYEIKILCSFVCYWDLDETSISFSLVRMRQKWKYVPTTIYPAIFSRRDSIVEHV